MKRGFSLIELLVVVGIVGLLLSLLMPAVNDARERSRQVKCLANLRSIGTALNNYHDLDRCFPPGCVNISDPRYSSGPAWRDRGVLVFLLPFVEAPAVSDALNHRVSVLSLENRTTLRSSVATYACPSDPQGGLPISAGDKFPPSFAATSDAERLAVRASYAFASGRLEPTDHFTTYPPNVSVSVLRDFDGCFFCWKSVRIGEIVDGLSQTAFASDRSAPVACSSNPTATGCERTRWWVEGSFIGTVYNAMTPPSFVGKLTGVRSVHPGGVHVLFGDGSARFVSNSVDSWPIDGAGEPLGAINVPTVGWTNLPPTGVWQALHTRAGGETLSLD